MLLFAMFILSTCLWGSYFAISLRWLVIAWLSANWPITFANCKRVEFFERPHSDGDEFRVEVAYSYTFEGREYEGSTVFNGYGGSSNREKELRLYEEISKNRERLPIHVNRLTPSISCVYSGVQNGQLFHVGFSVAGWLFCTAILFIAYQSEGGVHNEF